MPRPDGRIGTTLAGYRIESVVGRGGMGVVYRARQENLDRSVALKLLAADLADDESFRQRFLRESRLAATLEHPNIIPIYEAGEAEGDLFLAMRFVDGSDLEQRLKSGPLDPARAVAILWQVAGAIDAAHARGLVHRDIKPANVLVDWGDGGGEDHAFLTDFGLTKRTSSVSGLTQAGGFLGSVDYVAPEQVEGRPVDARADIYAFACTAFRCLTGERPFAYETDVAVINAHLREAPPRASARRADLPAAVDRVIARGMAKRPEARPPSARAFVAELRQALGVSGPGTERIPVVALPRRGLPRWALAAAAVSISGVLVLGAAASVPGGRPPSASPPRAAASPSASPVPTATSTTFPMAAEEALLARLPADLAATCGRTTALRVERNHGLLANIHQFSNIALACQPGGGAVTASFYAFRPGDGAAQDEVFRRVGEHGAANADCATGVNAYQRWSLAADYRGYLHCYVEGGRPVLIWSENAMGLLGVAVGAPGKPAELYAWWKQTAPYVRP